MMATKDSVRIVLDSVCVSRFIHNRSPIYAVRIESIENNGLIWLCTLSRAPECRSRNVFKCVLMARSANQNQQSSCFAFCALKFWNGDDLVCEYRFPRHFYATGYFGPRIEIFGEKLYDLSSDKKLWAELIIDAEKPKIINTPPISVVELPEILEDTNKVQLAGLSSDKVFVCFSNSAALNQRLNGRGIFIFGAHLGQNNWRQLETSIAPVKSDYNFQDYSAELSADYSKIAVLAREHHDAQSSLYLHLLDLNNATTEHWPVDLDLDLVPGGPARFGETALGWLVLADDSCAYVIGPNGFERKITQLPPESSQIRFNYTRIFCLSGRVLSIFDLSRCESGWTKLTSLDTRSNSVLALGPDMLLPLMAEWQMGWSGVFSRVCVDLENSSFCSFGRPSLSIVHDHPGIIVHHAVRFRAGKMAWIRKRRQEGRCEMRLIDTNLDKTDSLKFLASRAVRMSMNVREDELMRALRYKGSRMLCD